MFDVPDQTNTPSPTEGVIKCLQINLHHCEAAVSAFNDWMTKDGQTTGKIGLICEPYINENENVVKNFNLKDFNVFYDNKKGKVRTCIVASKNLDVWPLHQFNCGDQSTIGIKTARGKTLIFAATYMGHDAKEGPPPPFLKNFKNFVRQKVLAL